MSGIFNCHSAEKLCNRIFRSLVILQCIQVARGVMRSLVFWSMSRIFHKIMVPCHNNHVLFPKIQTFLKNKSFGGIETFVNNGTDSIKTGWMVAFKPFAIINVSQSSVSCATDTVQRINYVEIYINRIHHNPHTFIKYINNMNKSDNLISINTSSATNGWNTVKMLEIRTLPLLYPDEMISKIHSSIDYFLDNKDEYHHLGKNYKLTILFYGPAGSGKTSLLKHLAIKYNRDIYIIDPHAYFGNMPSFEKDISSLSNLTRCNGGILVLEDIDRFFLSVHNKQEYHKMSHSLNFLDGLYTPDNTIIIMTANCKGNIPESVKIDGRIDLMVNFPYVDDIVIGKICKMYDLNPNQVQLNSNTCTLSEAIKHIETSLSQLRKAETIIISRASDCMPQEHRSIDSMSVIGGDDMLDACN